ncbi:T-cell leukemia translocation-altered gene protein homolog isoform X4 [Narcine bancroftii]|uniref:T-cell leukemia translocation-altered gene protein homolog isoform X4 n=1 Tax=Narcine bancroftii TaxID=1343680 RepID=UPI0038312DBB
MELPWDLGLFSGLVQSALSFCSEFARDWGANDMRVTVFKILLGWLLCSLVAIHLAWKFYGATVNDMYYRQDIFNILLQQGMVPTCFKQTSIIPVPKKSAVTCLNNHQPLALTSTVMVF